jgi:hypothetical protein
MVSRKFKVGDLVDKAMLPWPNSCTPLINFYKINLIHITVDGWPGALWYMGA